MIKKMILTFLFFLIFIFSCKKETTVIDNSDGYIFKQEYTKEKLPTDLKWITNESDPVYASSEAKKGGTIYGSMMSFPLTFRIVGPDSNTGFRDYILGNQMSLIAIHPNTGNIIPEIATHWAYGSDKKTMYFKLDKNAEWSDGTPVTAQDFAYTIEFMRSKDIVAPWYNDYYTRTIDNIKIYDDYTISISATHPMPDLHLFLSLNPTPRHFYGKIDKDFVTKYNWAIVPNTGPYQITKFKKGEYIILERKKNWWAANKKYNINRFNVDKVVLKVISNENLAWEYFKKGKIDVEGLTMPLYWHEKANIPEFNNGYINKIWYYNDKPQSDQGFFLNLDKEIFKDKNVRYAFAHAMNFDKVIKEVLWNEYYRLPHAFTGYGRYSNNKIKPKEFSIEKVKYYMTKSGWSLGDDGIWKKGNTRYSVQVTYGTDLHTPRLVVLKEEAKKCGIELVLDLLDPAAAYKKEMEKKHDVVWSGWGTGLRPQYWEFYHSVNAHKSQTNNITNTDDKEMDKLIEAFDNSTNENERINLSLKIQEKIDEIGCFVPSFMVPYVRVGYWRWMKLPTKPAGTKVSESLFEVVPDPNYGTSTGGLFWIDEDLKKETLDAIKKGIKFPPVTIIDDTYKMQEIK
jgi:microcin C transport system substrate-binding protein